MRKETLTNQLRKAIDAGGKSRYQIAKETGIDEATLSRFMHGKGRLVDGRTGRDWKVPRAADRDRQARARRKADRSWRAYRRTRRACGESFLSVPTERRQAIRLGRVPIKTARTIKTHVENLAAAALGQHAPDAETSAWVGGTR